MGNTECQGFGLIAPQAKNNFTAGADLYRLIINANLAARLHPAAQYAPLYPLPVQGQQQRIRGERHSCPQQ